jgi:hypothetical protein
MDWLAAEGNSERKVEPQIRKGIYRLEGDKLLILMPNLPRTPRPVAFVIRPDPEGVERLSLRRMDPFPDRHEQRERILAFDAKVQENAYYRLQSIVSTSHDGQYDLDFNRVPWTRAVPRNSWGDLLDLRDVASLRLRDCSFVGDPEMQVVGKLTALERLDLHATDVGDAGVAEFGALENLRQLDLSLTSVSDAGLATLAQLPRLKEVILHGSMVTEKGIGGLRAKRGDLSVVWQRSYTPSQRNAARALSHIDFKIEDRLDPYLQPQITTCQITFPVNLKIIDSSAPPQPPDQEQLRSGYHRAPSSYYRTIEASLVAGYLEQLPAPTAVDVLDSAMDDVIFRCLRGIRGLVQLKLDGTQVTDAGLVELNRHQSLRWLELSHAKNLTDTGVAGLGTLVNLELLRLDGIELTTEGLTPLLNLGQLKEMSLLRRALTDDLYTKFRQKGVRLLAH